MIVAIVDYGAGNLRSCAKAFEIAGRNVAESIDVRVTADPAVVAKADRIVLPGDGAFPDCRRGLAAVDGLTETLTEAVRAKGRPFLGICVGMQLLADTGLEYEETAGLGWIPGVVRHIEPKEPHVKVPHMGWNTLAPCRAHPVLDGIRTGKDGLHAYFLHAYHLDPGERADVVAEADYSGHVTAIVARDNILGTQFHPEKSQKLGLALVANFLRWRP